MALVHFQNRARPSRRRRPPPASFKRPAGVGHDGPGARAVYPTSGTTSRGRMATRGGTEPAAAAAGGNFDPGQCAIARFHYRCDRRFERTARDGHAFPLNSHSATMRSIETSRGGSHEITYRVHRRGGLPDNSWWNGESPVGESGRGLVEGNDGGAVGQARRSSARPRNGDARIFVPLRHALLRREGRRLGGRRLSTQGNDGNSGSRRKHPARPRGGPEELSRRSRSARSARPSSSGTSKRSTWRSRRR